jgi:hypothetical protein
MPVIVDGMGEINLKKSLFYFGLLGFSLFLVLIVTYASGLSIPDNTHSYPITEHGIKHYLTKGQSDIYLFCQKIILILMFVFLPISLFGTINAIKKSGNVSSKTKRRKRVV